MRELALRAGDTGVIAKDRNTAGAGMLRVLLAQQASVTSLNTVNVPDER